MAEEMDVNIKLGTSDFRKNWGEPRVGMLRWASGLWQISRRVVEEEVPVGTLVWGLVKGPLGFSKQILHYTPIEGDVINGDETGVLWVPGVHWDRSAYNIGFNGWDSSTSIMPDYNDFEGNSLKAVFSKNEPKFRLEATIRPYSLIAYNLRAGGKRPRLVAKFLPTVRGHGSLSAGERSWEVSIKGYMDIVGAQNPRKTGWDYAMLWGDNGEELYVVRNRYWDGGWKSGSAALFNGFVMDADPKGVDIEYRKKARVKTVGIDVPVEWRMRSGNENHGIQAELSLDPAYGEKAQSVHGALGLYAAENRVIGTVRYRRPLYRPVEIPVTGFVESTWTPRELKGMRER